LACKALHIVATGLASDYKASLQHCHCLAVLATNPTPHATYRLTCRHPPGCLPMLCRNERQARLLARCLGASSQNQKAGRGAWSNTQVKNKGRHQWRTDPCKHPNLHTLAQYMSGRATGLCMLQHMHPITLCKILIGTGPGQLHASVLHPNVCTWAWPRQALTP